MNQRSTGARAQHERNVYGNIAYYMFRAGGISINYQEEPDNMFEKG